MKAINLNGMDLNIQYTNALTAGYGHKKIIVELYYLGHSKKFIGMTNNMSDYDDATELEGQDKDEALFNLVVSKIEDDVAEWILEIENN